MSRQGDPGTRENRKKTVNETTLWRSTLSSGFNQYLGHFHSPLFFSHSKESSSPTFFSPRLLQDVYRHTQGKDSLSFYHFFSTNHCWGKKFFRRYNFKGKIEDKQYILHKEFVCKRTEVLKKLETKSETENGVCIIWKYFAIVKICVFSF